MGVVMGLFFASYLVKLGRMGVKKGGKPLPPPKEFTEVAKRQTESASMRTGSTQSGSDLDAKDDTDKFL